MKVFISWSGENTASHKVAIALGEWLPSVINCVAPFVSSENIQSGERGLARIEEMLKDSGFGILCITKENYKAPWLLFEAGALSNNPNKVPVVPFLFGLTPSDLSGSPLTQFQATTYSGKDSIKKLMQSLNKECADRGLSESLFDKSFDMWYPELEKALKGINPESDEKPDVDSDKNQAILEELLDLTRSNQKLLGNANGFTSGDFDQLADRISALSNQIDRNEEYSRRRRRISPMMIDELLHSGRIEMRNGNGLLVILSLFRDDLPWIYDLGKDLLVTLNSKMPVEEKKEATRAFMEMLEFSTHAIKLDKRIGSKDDYMLLRELPMMLERFFQEII